MAPNVWPRSVGTRENNGHVGCTIASAQRGTKKRRTKGSSERLGTTAHLLETLCSNWSLENDERLHGRDLNESQIYESDGGEDDGNPRSARRTMRDGEPSSSDHFENSSEETVVKRNPSKEKDGILWASNSVTVTEKLVYKLSWRGSNIVLSTSSGTIRTNCFNCELVWLAHPNRFCRLLENSRRRVESWPCSRLVSAARIKPNGSVPNCEAGSEQKANHYKNSIKMSVV